MISPSVPSRNSSMWSRVRSSLKSAALPEFWDLPPYQRLLGFGAGSLQRWDVHSDREHGGFSDGALEAVSEESAAFRGSTSLVIDDARAEASTHVAPEDGRGATKTGWCAMRTAVSRERWELEDFHALRLRLRPDGRRYALNLQSEGILGDDIDRGADLFQVHLPVPPTTGEWLELDLPFGLFQLTWRGYVQSAQYAVNRNRLTHVGLIVADGDEGPFSLEIGEIGAVRLDQFSSDPRVRSALELNERMGYGDTR